MEYTKDLEFADFDKSEDLHKAPIKSLKGNIYVKELSVDQIRELNKRKEDGELTSDDVSIHMIALAAAKRDGTPIFSNPAQLSKTGFKSFPDLTKAVLSVNGLTEEALEEIGKN
jgi:hypothetical protein